jgi:hypothetical protein
MRCDTYIPLLAVFTVGSAAVAAPLEAHSESHGAHVHGAAQLTFATDAEQVELMFDSPAVNLLGFEHAPKSATEQAAWHKSLAMLNSGQWLQLPADAECELQQQTINNPWSANSTDKHQHADIELTLRYRCKVPSALTEVRLDLFRHAADLQNIAVQWVSGAQQGAVTLTPESSVFSLKTSD